MFVFFLYIETYNDNPNILPDDQIFMILEMEDGGTDVEEYVFNSANQALFAFIQVCCYQIHASVV